MLSDLDLALMFPGRPFHIAASSPTPVWVRADAEATKFQGQKVGLLSVFYKGILMYFIYAMRRVQCSDCGVKVESVPWAHCKNPITTAYAWFLSGWARHLSWSQAAKSFRTSWHTAYRSVDQAVQWGRAHQDLSGITAIGVDELCWGKWHRYVTVVYQINRDSVRLLWLGEHRKAKTLLRFFRWFNKERTSQLEHICSDMWRPYLKVIAKKGNQAIHILDRFHIMMYLNKAIDKVRATEAKDLAAKGYMPILKKNRWLLLKRPENLTDKQDVSLATLLQFDLKMVRSYLLKEDFQCFWHYRSAHWAGQSLDRWCARCVPALNQCSMSPRCYGVIES